MPAPVNAGARLDRLPIGPFHYRVITLIGIGMFFDGFDIYVGGTVLAATLKSGFSTLAGNAQFISATFLGMMIGAGLAGFLGDRFGRRFTYQANLLVFGLASIAAAFAPDMAILLACRFVMGVGLGAENVVGYATLAEFVPAQSRGRWQGLMAVFVVTSLPISSFLGYTIVPALGWRALFVIGGLGALVVWYLRKRLPESPRWLEAAGRGAEAETLLRAIEATVPYGAALPEPTPIAAPPAADLAMLFRPPLLARLVLGCVCLVVINTLLYGFVTWLPSFFVRQGLSIAASFGYTLLMACGAPIGAAIGALTADRWGRRPTIIGASALAVVLGAVYPSISDPALLTLAGFALTIPIYVLVALLFGIYIPELFPTEIRLRGAGLCNMVGRGATIATPFGVVALFNYGGVAAVMSLMVALLLLQIAAVFWFGIEPARRPLEELQPEPAPDARPVYVES